MAVKHTFVSAIADGGDASLVRPSNWNASHSVDSGQATIPFATWKRLDQVSVTGQTNIVAGSQVFVSIYADNDDVIAQSWETPRVGNLIAGTGFTIFLQALVGTFKGNVKINWFWI